MRKIYSSLVLSTALVLSLGSQEVFARIVSVANVAVDVKDKTAVAAKEKSLVQARRQAFKKLAVEQPVLGINPSAALPNDKRLEELVEDLEVVREKMSGVRYMAVYNVNFDEARLLHFVADPDNVNSTLDSGAGQNSNSNIKNVSYSGDSGDTVRQLGAPQKAYAEEAPTIEADDIKAVKKTSLSLKNYVIVPIYIGGDDAQLWEEKNPWLLHWVARDTKSNGKEAGVNYRVPLADLRDRTACTIEQLTTEKIQPISMIIERYHADGAIVPILKSLEDGQNSHEIQVKVFSRSGRISSGETVTIEGKGRSLSQVLAVAATFAFNPDSSAEDNYVPSELGSKNTPNDSSTFPVDQKAAAQNAVDGMTLKATFQNLGEWTDIKRRLSLASFVGRFDIKNLSKQSAEIVIGSDLSRDKLISQLGSIGLTVSGASGSIPQITLGPRTSAPQQSQSTEVGPFAD